MLQRMENKSFTRDDAFELTEKLIRKGSPNYIIRDALVERGMSAFMANGVIIEVRRVHLNDAYLEPNYFSRTQIALIIVAVSIVIMLLFVLVNSVS